MTNRTPEIPPRRNVDVLMHPFEISRAQIAYELQEVQARSVEWGDGKHSRAMGILDNPRFLMSIGAKGKNPEPIYYVYADGILILLNPHDDEYFSRDSKPIATSFSPDDIDILGYDVAALKAHVENKRDRVTSQLVESILEDFALADPASVVITPIQPQGR